MNLRDYARGQECQIRIPGVCCGDDSTVVLCHLRMAGITGTGMKAPDELGAWGCHTCHAETDRRTRIISDEDAVQLMFLEGIMRTLNILILRGIVTHERGQAIRGKRK